MTASRYQVIAQLAQGGMGEILLARQLGPAGFAKLVVLKRPLRMSVGSRAAITALAEEARLLARINHPNVCQVHDLEEADGELFLVLEYLEGLSGWALLTDAEATGRPFEPRVACGLVAQVCDGLDAIHSVRGPNGALAGVVHRDISPGNLFVTATGTAKILDLGIAKQADSEDRTPYGRVKGKLPYLSPEQVAGKAIDARSDLFSLGLVLYDFARGRRPSSDRVGAIACTSLELDTLPSPLVEIVRRAVAVEPAARFASARDMGAALRRADAAGHPELADWLAARFADELAQRRARHGGADADAVSSETQILSLQSVLPADDEPPPLRSRATERLVLPDDDEPHPIAKPARGNRRIAVAVIAGVVAIGLVAVAIVSSVARDKPAAASPSPPPPIVAMNAPPAPAPTPPPPAPTPTPEPTPVAPPEPELPKSHPSPRHHTESPGSLTIDSRPYAVVRLDGHALGTTPIWRVAVPPGHHKLHASTSDGRERDLAVQIEASRERKILLDWSAP